MEKKSCSLTVHAEGESGYLYIQQGELIDAATGELNGKEAALKIIAWDNAEIEMDSVCRCESSTINSPIGFILMEAHRIKDEDNFHNGTRFSAVDAGTSSLENVELHHPPPLVRLLSNSQDIKEFAIFNDGNRLEYSSPEPCSVAKMDPAYYLSTCKPIGGFMDSSNMKYILFTTGEKQQYLVFQWGNQRAILALRSTCRAGQLYRELESGMSKETSINYRRGSNATTH